jgi:hypothetical protein
MSGKLFMDRRKLALTLLCGLLLGLHLSNIWRLRTYPFTDLPNHLAEATLIRTLTLHPDDWLANYYRIEINPFTPAITHAVFCALFPDIEFGNKVFYSLYLLILVGSLWLLIHFAGGDAWLGLLACIFFYNLSTMWGFASFTFGIALVFLSMVFLVRCFEKPSLRNYVLLGASMLLLYYTHVMVWVFASVVIIFSVLSYRGIPFRLRLIMPITLLPGWGLFGLYLRYSTAFSGQVSLLYGLSEYYLGEYFISFPNRFLAFLTNDNSYLAPGLSGTILGLLFSIPVLGNLVTILINRKKMGGSVEPSVSQHIAAIFLLTSLFFFFFLPLRLPGQDVVYPRFSVFVYLGALWMLSYLITHHLRPLFYGIFLPLLILHAGLWFNFFSSFNHAAQPFQELMYHAASAQQRTLGAVIENYRFRGEPAFLHYQNYQIIWNHGAVPTNMTNYRYRLVDSQQKPALPRYEGWITGNDDIDILLDRYRNLDMLLCQGEYACEASLKTGRYKTVGQQDGWMLLENLTSK